MRALERRLVPERARLKRRASPERFDRSGGARAPGISGIPGRIQTAFSGNPECATPDALKIQ
jgi:hypothetical protein